MIPNFWSIAFSLFFLMDSIGNVPLYLTVLRKVPAARQRVVIFRELLIALGFIVLFTLMGQSVFDFLGVREDAAHISGGLILFLISIRMIFPPQEPVIPPSFGEPLVVPLAIPLVAGPSVLTTVMLYSQQVPMIPLLGAVGVAWGMSTAVLVSSPFLLRILGDRGLIALERLMGLILTLLAVQMLLTGIQVFLHHCDSSMIAKALK